MDKMKVKSSEPRDYMGRAGKGLTTSMVISTKILNKKQKAIFAIIDMTKQDFRNFLKKFKDPPNLSYKIKQVHKYLTED